MTDINEENKDLIENKIPFGLLDEETQKRMRAWKHGWQMWNQDENFEGGRDEWHSLSFITQFTASSCYVLRAKPAPEPEIADVKHELIVRIESPFLVKTVHFRLFFDRFLQNPTIEEIE